MYCKHCGQPISPGASFCKACGQPAPGGSPTDEAGDGAAKRKRLIKRALICAGVLLAVLIVLGLMGGNVVANTKGIVFEAYGDMPIGEVVEQTLKNVEWTSEKNGDGSYTVTVRGTSEELNARIGVDFLYTEDGEYCFASTESAYINGSHYSDTSVVAMVMSLLYGDSDGASAALLWYLLS